jgi:hypothetical protein
MEMLKIAMFVYVAGVLVHFYFLPFQRALLWPMVILGLSLSFSAVILNAISSLLFALATTLKLYGFFFTTSTFAIKGNKDEKSTSDDVAA